MRPGASASCEASFGTYSVQYLPEAELSVGPNVPGNDSRDVK